MDKFSKLLEIGKYIAIILLLAFLYSKLNNKDNLLSDLERKMQIERDSLKEHYEGRYSKLIDDYNTEKSLNKDLKEHNKKLYDEIKDSNDRIVSLTKTVLKLKDGTKVITLPEPIKEKDTLSFYYPNKDSSFVTHTLMFENLKTIRSNWEFKPIKLDMVVTETEKGIFKVDIDTEKFIEVSSFEMKSLPMTPITRPTKDYFKWTYGAGIWKDPYTYGVDLYGGVKLGNVNALLRFQPSSRPQIGFTLLFND